MRRGIVWREICMLKRGANRAPPSPQVVRPMDIRPHGSMKVGSRGVEHFALTERITAIEFPRREAKLDPICSMGDIKYVLAVVAPQGRRFKTGWTARCGMRGGDSDDQTVFCDLNLVGAESSDKAIQFRTRALKSLLQPVVELIGAFSCSLLPPAWVQINETHPVS